MADYWKSQPKKFCDYCKCWIADNKPSIDFHERGKNHKENVAKKISEIKQKSLDKVKEDEKMAKDFAAMEEAATKAYQEDLKRLGLKAEPAETPSLPIKQEEKKEKKEKKEKRKKEKQTKEVSSNEAKEWCVDFLRKATSIIITRNLEVQSQWEKPEGFQDTTCNSQKEAVWVEGTDDNGRTYYYNKETGDFQKANFQTGDIYNFFFCYYLVSTWEKPEGFVSFSIKNNSGENSSEEISKNESQKVSPYGEWQQVNPEGQQVKPEKDEKSSPKKKSSAPRKLHLRLRSLEKVDLELPSKESNSAPVVEVPEDAKVIFKEKTVTSLGETTEEMPVFRKRKFENGKSRNFRQRLSDH
ncbi:putative WW domain-binding protein [Naja naja]|nr:putative WW domain-binding protein [Naja naja]